MCVVSSRWGDLGAQLFLLSKASLRTEWEELCQFSWGFLQCLGRKKSCETFFVVSINGLTDRTVYKHLWNKQCYRVCSVGNWATTLSLFDCNFSFTVVGSEEGYPVSLVLGKRLHHSQCVMAVLFISPENDFCFDILWPFLFWGAKEEIKDITCRFEFRPFVTSIAILHDTSTLC